MLPAHQRLRRAERGLAVRNAELRLVKDLELLVLDRLVDAAEQRRAEDLVLIEHVVVDQH